jgi:hypothetical protein
MEAEVEAEEGVEVEAEVEGLGTRSTFRTERLR